jgi:hypothetical protein
MASRMQHGETGCLRRTMKAAQKTMVVTKFLSNSLRKTSICVYCIVFCTGYHIFLLLDSCCSPSVVLFELYNTIVRVFVYYKFVVLTLV